MSLILEQQGIYFKNLEFTDFKIQCNGIAMNVHKVVLASHSRVFRHALVSRFLDLDRTND